MADRKLSFGIIGCGKIAATHAQQMVSKGKLVAVCDVDEAKAKIMADRYKVPFYQNLETMFARHPELDLVSVCTPNGLHAKHSITALNYGAHVICEKPMALTVADCLDMMRAAEVAGKKLFVVKQNRYNPPVITLRNILNENRLGRIFSIQLNCFWNRGPHYYHDNWHGTKQLDGGTLFTQFSHFIDLLVWLFGDIIELEAITANYAHEGIIEFEDTGIIMLSFRQGAIGAVNYTVNSYACNMEGSLTVFGEKGTLKIGGQYLNNIEYCKIENYEIPEHSEGNPANTYGGYSGSMSNHDKVFDNVIEVLQNKAKMTTSPEDGLKTVEIINRIYAKARSPLMTSAR